MGKKTPPFITIARSSLLLCCDTALSGNAPRSGGRKCDSSLSGTRIVRRNEILRSPLKVMQSSLRTQDIPASDMFAIVTTRVSLVHQLNRRKSWIRVAGA
jgi:hypothetical protein